MYYDDSGNSAVHAIRGAWWTGTRIGAGINYGIQAATGASLGVLLYEAFNDEVLDFGDAANDEDFKQCPVDPDSPDECELLKGQLDILWVQITQEKGSSPPRGGDLFTQKLKVKTMIERYKQLALKYNAKCVGKGYSYRNPNIFD